jgi:prepilin-type N-terminal cleavage/methylation domain-containing protein
MRKAFTLIELMIVVTIIGVLAAIAIPKFSNLIDKSKEGYTKGALSTVRSVLSVYYADNEGKFPADNLAVLIGDARYVDSLPVTKLPRTGHSYTAAVHTADSTATFITDAGGWAYLNNPSSGNWGEFKVNCTHSDSGARDWSEF